jgi:hypothetical protein
MVAAVRRHGLILGWWSGAEACMHDAWELGAGAGAGVRDGRTGTLAIFGPSAHPSHRSRTARVLLRGKLVGWWRERKKRAEKHVLV